MTNAERCPSCKNDKMFRCIRKRGHAGDHIAYVNASEIHREPQSWPQTPRQLRRAAKLLPAPAAQPPSAALTARVCTFCGKGKGTICYRQDGGPFFAHLGCFRRYRLQQAKGGAQ